MNPAIHHPAWYLATSIIDKPEFEESLRNLVVVTPQFAQFVSKGFSVFCLPDRWQISCETAEGTRIVVIATATFDRLGDTPVSAYGVNHDFHVETDKEIPSILATI